MGQRIPLAFRFARLLEDLVIRKCGPSTGTPAAITFPRPFEPSVIQAMFQQSCYREQQGIVQEGLHEPG
ncbi:hypothetical protein C0989_007683, partial [Termitomyces sp. Mn162]